MSQHRKRIRWKRGFALLSVLGMTVALAVILGGSGAASASQDNTNKVTICHRTNSTHNPYVQETVSFDGTTGKLHDTGQGDHTSHTGPVWDSSMPNGGDWGDIIPPYTWGDGGSYAGLNWSDAGQAIYNNGCNPTAPPPPPTKEKVSGLVTFAEGSVQCMRDVVLYEPPTYDVGGNVHVLYDVTRGHHEADFSQTVTVHATGVDDPSKYELTGQTTWTYTFAAQPSPPPDCGSVLPLKHHPKPPKHHTPPPSAPKHNTPAVAETGASSGSSPWLPIGSGVAALLLVSAAALRRGQAG